MNIDKKIKIGIETSADTAGIEKAEAGINRLEQSSADLNLEIRETHRSTETFTAGVTKLENPTRNNANAVLLFSQGLEDMQYGIRGVLNNIPGLVMALGGSAGIAGAISIAAVAGSQLISVLGDVETKAEDAAEKIKTIAENAGALKTDELNAQFDAITELIENADALKQRWESTQAAQDLAATAAISDGEDLIAIQRTIAEWLGEQRDAYKEIEELAERAAARRAELERQALETEQNKLNVAKDAVVTAGEILGKTETELSVKRADLVAALAKLEALKNQKAELERIASLSAGGIPFTGQGEFVDPNQSANFQKGVAARAKLDDPAFAASLAAQQEFVASLAAKIESVGASLPRLNQAFSVAKKNADDIEAAVSIASERISDTAQKDEIKGKLDAIAKTNEQFAKGLSAAVGEITAGNAAGAAAKATIENAVADGKITADETRAVAEASRTLIGQLQAGISSTNGNVVQLINLATSFQKFQSTVTNQILELQRQAETLQLKLESAETRFR